MELGKKGSLFDIANIGFSLAFFALIVLIGFYIADTMNTEFIANDAITGRAQTEFTEIRNMFPGVIDNSFLFLMIGLTIIALILAMMVAVHPVFFVFYFLLLILITFLSGVFSNVYLEAANTPQFLPLANELTFISHIMGAMPFIVGILGFVLAIIMFKTYQANQI